MSDGSTGEKKVAPSPPKQKKVVAPKTKTVNKQIRGLLAQGKAKVEGLNNLNYIVTGFSQDGLVTVRDLVGSNGKVTRKAFGGDYFGAFNNGTTVKLEGSTGNYLGLNLSKGDIIITRDSGDYTATYQGGGIIVVRGNCGNYAGQGMYGGTLFIEGNCAAYAGGFMVGGEIIVVGDCGDHTGLDMKNGIIFVRGEIEGIGRGARTQTLSSKDKSRLQGVFKDFDMDYEAKDFVKVIPEVAP